MIEVKLSLMGVGGGVDLSPFTGNHDNVVGDCRFHVNDDVTIADVWLVLEGPTRDYEACEVPPGALVHLTAEPARPVGYLAETPGMRQFMDQFDRFYTCLDYADPRGAASLPFLPWMINANHGPSIYADHSRGYEHLRALSHVPKTREISVFCSMQDATPEHRLRLRFVQHLQDYFGDRIDWFGNGGRSLAEKWDGIAPYRYAIALENQSNRNVITEKIQDVFLGMAFPIYWGAPNVGDYFAPGSFLAIDARDFVSSVAAIERLLDEDPYEQRLDLIAASKTIVLEELNFVVRMAGIAHDTHVRSQRWPTRRAEVRGAETFSGRNLRARTATQLARGSRGLSRLARRVAMDY